LNPALAKGGASADFDTEVRLELGDLFQFEEIQRLGPGSIVYRAIQLPGSRPVALKVFRKGIPEDRFARAATQGTQIEHPHLVPVLDWGVTQQFFWYTMPLVTGDSLDRVLSREGPFDLRRCLRMVEQVASAIQYGHRRGAVHGAVKPENVLMNQDGWTLLADFGMPSAAERLDPEAVGRRLAAYTAPEILQGGPPRPASDQYGLAVLIHECLTGSAPATPGTPDEPFPLPGNPKVAHPRPVGKVPLPERVLPALRRAMAPSPQDRFPTVLAFVATLDSAPISMRAPEFAPNPQKGTEPRVLTMEPESHTRRIVVWAVILALVVGGVFAAKRFVGPQRMAQISDRFDRWYEADAPAGGMMVSQPRSPAALTTADSVRRPGPTSPSPDTGSPSPARQTPPVSANRSGAPVARKPAPATPAPSRPIQAPSATAQPEPAAPADPARLSVSSSPWGTVYIDGLPVGNTPKVNLSVPPGTHSIRIARDGFDPYERTLEFPAGETVRLTGIVLQESRR
jgi:serine/threonine-protein kinase